MNKDLIVYVNGRFVPRAEARISVFDQGVLFGDGVFEGIRVYNGRLFKGWEHIRRLFASAKAILLPVPLTEDEMLGVTLETCRRNGIRDGYLRLVVTRGEGDLSLYPRELRPTVFCIASTIALYPPEVYEKGMAIATASQRRNRAAVLDPQIKSLNYLNNILAKIEAVRAGVPEALMLTEEGLVAEGTGDNIFIVKNGEIMTPPLQVGILNGITRQAVMELAVGKGLPVTEKVFTLYNVYAADECFLTGTAAEVVAVCEVDGRMIGDGRPGPVTRTLMEAFRTLTRAGGPEISAGETAL